MTFDLRYFLGNLVSFCDELLPAFFKHKFRLAIQGSPQILIQRRNALAEGLVPTSQFGQLLSQVPRGCSFAWRVLAGNATLCRTRRRATAEHLRHLRLIPDHQPLRAADVNVVLPLLHHVAITRNNGAVA
ncbi:MAG: hypothetical protein WAW26_10970, partial [Anaerolineae bacterium]